MEHFIKKNLINLIIITSVILYSGINCWAKSSATIIYSGNTKGHIEPCKA